MAQDDYGAAEPIANWARKYGLLAKKKSKPQPKADTLWHDAQVKAANDSFRKTVEPKKLGIKKPSTAKKTRRKRTAKRR